MSLNIYNSFTNEMEEFKPRKDAPVKMYVCGQTVYDYMHVGHARTYTFFDILKRYLEFLGHSVMVVINITDVNDKINDRAEKENRSPWEVAEEFSIVNLEDFDSLGIEADAYPRASEYIEEIIDHIEKLEEEGFAYEAKGDVFFDVRKFDKYGELSNQRLEDMRTEREDEVISTDKKRNPEDFVLWRAREGSSHSPVWSSPWGEGVPGWHIECSVMALSLLGDRIDIHGGGSDLLFPHHENEIAQVEGVTGDKWVDFWMHTGMVHIEGEKMSKSLGNIVSAREVLEEYGPGAIRLMMAGSHYREPMDFSRARAEEALKNYQKLKNTVKGLKAEIKTSNTIPDKLGEEDLDFLETLFELKTKFIEAMNDDFNTPQALKYFYEIESLSNSYLSKDPKKPVMKRFLRIMLELGSIIGIFEEEKIEEGESRKVDSLLRKILELREELRKEEKYEIADSIRDKIEEAGIEIEDSDRGPRWKI